MFKKRIGITQKIVKHSRYNEDMDCLDTNWAKLLIPPWQAIKLRNLILLAARRSTINILVARIWWKVFLPLCNFWSMLRGMFLSLMASSFMKRKNLESVLDTAGDIVVMVDDGWYDLWSSRNDHPLNDAETLKYGEHGQSIELGKVPSSLNDIAGQYTGLIKITHSQTTNFISFYDRLDRNILYDDRAFNQIYMTSFLQLLIDTSWKVMPARVKHGWLKIDTAKDLLLYERLSAEGKLDVLWRPNA